MTDNKFRLPYFPASFFGMVMGITGLSIALLAVNASVTLMAGKAVLAIATLLFIGLLVAYLLKVARFPDAVQVEIRHPVKMNFVPAISISLILLSIAFYAIGQTQLSFWLWSVGVAAHLVLTLWVLHHWIHHDFFKIEHSTPAWFIPIVGNILVPIVGVHHAPAEISWFFFSIGIVFWPVIMAILFNRIIFHPPIIDKLIPTLFIFIAPPAVGFISYVALNGGVLDGFARVLYFFGAFMTLLMLVSAGKFLQVKFALSCWAYTFPIAAISIASFKMFHLTDVMLYQWLGMALLGLLSLMILVFAWKTLQAVRHRHICTPGH
jgi:tellurite resistance protein